MLNKNIYKVGAIDYEVKDMDYVEIDDNKNYIGKCTYTNSTIEIVKGLSKTRREQTLIHELLHAMLNEAGISNHDEDLVNRLGIVLHQFIIDNL